MVRIFFLICLLLIQPAYANVFEHEAQLDKIVKELPELNSIKCKFRQEKQISNILLKSSGDFTFDKGKGVIFLYHVSGKEYNILYFARVSPDKQCNCCNF